MSAFDQIVSLIFPSVRRAPPRRTEWSDDSIAEAPVEAWPDEKIFEQLRQDDGISFAVTNVTRIFASGASDFFGHQRSLSPAASFERGPRAFEPASHWVDTEISGVVAGRHFMLVSVDLLSSQENGFGEFAFDTRIEYFAGWALPWLRVFIGDPKRAYATAFYESHRDALASGKTHSYSRVYKRRGDGISSRKELERGRSENFEVLGLQTWAELGSSNLPMWAIPPDRTEFDPTELLKPQRRVFLR
jgi:hypothetical protein